MNSSIKSLFLIVEKINNYNLIILKMLILPLIKSFQWYITAYKGKINWKDN